MNEIYIKRMLNFDANNTDFNKTYNSDISEDQNKSFIVEKFHYIWIGFLLIHLLYFFFMIIKLNCCKKDVLQEVNGDNPQLRKINEECAICIGNITNEVQLLCSHSFCAACLVNYGKHTFNMVDILCPICRAKSKVLFANFERNDFNKDQYDEILNYNHEFTQNNFTSLCFCIDFLRLFIFYMKQIANFENPRYRNQRACLSCFIIIVIMYFILLYSHDFKNAFEIIEDVFYYLCLIFVVAEYFYRNFRRRTNVEYELYASNPSEANDSIIEQGNGLERGERQF